MKKSELEPIPVSHGGVRHRRAGPLVLMLALSACASDSPPASKGGTEAADATGSDVPAVTGPEPRPTVDPEASPPVDPAPQDETPQESGSAGASPAGASDPTGPVSTGGAGGSGPDDAGGSGGKQAALDAGEPGDAAVPSDGGERQPGATSCEEAGGECTSIGGCLEAGGHSTPPEIVCEGGSVGVTCCLPQDSCGEVDIDCCGDGVTFRPACDDGQFVCVVGDPHPVGACP